VSARIPDQFTELFINLALFLHIKLDPKEVKNKGFVCIQNLPIKPSNKHNETLNRFCLSQSVA